jgi:hypothetical protein
VQGLGYVAEDEVKVIREEAVGMYEVAVLAAGSAKALDRWMEDHDYKYPGAMGDVVEDYVESGWVFVAVKARVGQSKGVEPRPGMRNTNDKLPAGATFDGYVQGMAFRYEVDAPVIPMRLSTFNGDDLHNRVYYIGPRPAQIEGIDPSLVKRQVDGKTLVSNLTAPLALRFVNGTRDEVPEHEWARIEASRNAEPHVSVARELIASDALAVASGQLSLPVEEYEKALLSIGEGLNLRGPEVDALHKPVLNDVRLDALADALPEVAELTLTLVDGDFPRQLLSEQNLSLTDFSMNAEENSASVWTIRPTGPTVRVERHHNGPSQPQPSQWEPFWR